MEFLYFLLTAISFLLTDATANIDHKKFAAWASVILLMGFILVNIAVTIKLARTDRNELKIKNRRGKERRRKDQERRAIEKEEKNARKELKE